VVIAVGNHERPVVRVAVGVGPRDVTVVVAWVWGKHELGVQVHCARAELRGDEGCEGADCQSGGDQGGEDAWADRTVAQRGLSCEADRPGHLERVAGGDSDLHPCSSPSRKPGYPATTSLLHSNTFATVTTGASPSAA